MGPVAIIRNADRAQYPEHQVVYVGRGSPLGNPFVMQNPSDTERRRVIWRFRYWLEEQLAAQPPNAGVLQQLATIRELASTGPVYLACFCAPKPCHAGVIRYFLEHGTFKDPARRLGPPSISP